MRCATYTTAEKYSLIKLAELLREDEEHEVADLKFFQDSLCAKYADGHVFFFSYGCFATWNLEPLQEKQLIDLLRRVAKNPLDYHFEEFEYKIGQKAQVVQDIITLEEKGDLVIQMLSVSYGLSQSIILSRFEDRVINRIEQTKHIPQELAEKGKISLSGRDIKKQIGSLFMERSSINLHSDILDVPGFFWDHPSHQELYTMTISDQELKARTLVLNTRLNIIRELFEVLNDALHNRHSAILEWIIILLIFIEVVLTISLHLLG